MTDCYIVTRFDRAGEAENCRGDFALVLEYARVWTRRHPGNFFRVSNLDRCDCDTDGLTEDERGQLIDAEHEGRAARGAAR